MGLILLWKKTSGSSLSLPSCEDTVKVSLLWTRHWICQHFDLGFSELWEINICYSSHPAYKPTVFCYSSPSCLRHKVLHKGYIILKNWTAPPVLGPYKACTENYKVAVIHQPWTLVQKLKFLAASEEQLKSPNLSTQGDTSWIITRGKSAAGSKSGLLGTSWRREHGEQALESKYKVRRTFTESQFVNVQGLQHLLD